MVTHSMQRAAALGDRLIMMHRAGIHDFKSAERQRLLSRATISWLH
jgi:ABC-type uncharacterized transport system ATPase component